MRAHARWKMEPQNAVVYRLEHRMKPKKLDIMALRSTMGLVARTSVKKKYFNTSKDEIEVYSYLSYNEFNIIDNSNIFQNGLLRGLWASGVNRKHCENSKHYSANRIRSNF